MSLRLTISSGFSWLASITSEETKLVNRRLLPKETVWEFECKGCGAEFFFRDFEKRPPNFCPNCGRRKA